MYNVYFRLPIGSVVRFDRGTVNKNLLEGKVESNDNDLAFVRVKTNKDKKAIKMCINKRDIVKVVSLKGGRGKREGNYLNR